MPRLGWAHHFSRPIPRIVLCNVWKGRVTFRGQSRTLHGATCGLGSSLSEAKPEHTMVQLMGRAHHFSRAIPNILLCNLLVGTSLFEANPEHLIVQVMGWAHHFSRRIPSTVLCNLWARFIIVRSNPYHIMVQAQGWAHHFSKAILIRLWNLWAGLILFRSQSRECHAAAYLLGSLVFEANPEHIIVQLMGWAHHFSRRIPDVCWCNVWAGLIDV